MYRYKQKNGGKIKRFFIVIFIIILTSILSILLYKIYENIEVKKYEVSDNNYQSVKTFQTIQEKNDITSILAKTTQSVVGISKIKNAGSTIFLKDGISSLGLGSGVIVSDDGYILSNEHVTGSKYSNCYVTFENGRTYSANVVWSDSDMDLSLCKINIKNLVFADLGDSNSVKVGEKVYAIGNPIGFEFQRTVTSGIISAKDRTIKIEEDNKTTYMDDLIQTDATINPGNSGGPLINEKGEIIGINSVKITSAEGIGFAVPINIIKPILNRLRTDEKFEEASLGIFAYDKNMIPYFNSKIELDKGVYVTQVLNNSSAKKSGLKVGDIITRIDNLELEKMCDLRCYIYGKRPGDTVTLIIYRNGKEQQVEVTLMKKTEV